MKNQEFFKQLEIKRNSPLLKGVLDKYQHIERLGHTETEGLLDGEVITQVKIDGANLTIAYSDGIIIASRNNVISKNKNPSHGFNGAIEYILSNNTLCELSKYYILRGEWLTRHTVTYKKEVMNHFWIFDVQTYDGRYLHYDEYSSILDKYGYDKYIPLLKRFNNPSIDDLIKLVNGPDDFGAEQKEGIVIKRYDFINKFGRTKWAKLISSDFQNKNKMVFVSGIKKEPELAFASIITDEFILKIINKIKDQDGDVTIEKMPQILGISWYELFQEELWDFVKKNKIKVFDFKRAKYFVEQRTRDIALAYFNGILK